jgi:hypothetical protein
MLYSLPQEKESVRDNWRTFLVNNRRDFTSKPTSVSRFGRSGAIILFDAESPIFFNGVEQLQTDAGTKITIGDGELFKQAQQNVSLADLQYQHGSCNSRLSVINTPVGIYFISANLGKIHQLRGDALEEISAINNRWWFNKYLPYKLLEDFPDYPHIDNPVVGIGCQSIYDNRNVKLYFCKKDYKLIDGWEGIVVYDVNTNSFTNTQNGQTQISLNDTNYFEDASWTVSFDPKQQYWISPHDWHPELALSGVENFITSRNNAAHRHNVRVDLFCNFYGVDYPFEIEQYFMTGQQVYTLRSLEYLMEAYTINDYREDKYHVLDFNFDEIVIHNTEQVSGYLRLNLVPKNDPFGRLSFPVFNADSIDVLYSKEEQKYRVNQFWDITRDRGEFSNLEFTMWSTFFNGYVKELNPNNLDYQKAALQRKKFRHYGNYVFFKKYVSGNKQMVLKLANTKMLYSPR